ncbi:MAG TPA: hypothetical protein DCR43_09015 [Bacteroidales bacterium]|nr:MAG: hypothetical protein A2X11_05140 [Bacteroidetes bacterium GWE2_42_24]OFY26597.1 MAG: hypothetical protein A2X09_03430 [Bacteroidetes bacterium GWF2_43_11]HAQ65973.1 hypothetical protein [Bacteroidales bacterium]HBZ67477.1 hypothetical protein [Bacteroidales bacterium]
MKTKLFSLFILVALFAFAKPTSAQGFQSQMITCNVYSDGSALAYDHYAIYARVVTINGHEGNDVILMNNIPNEFFPLSTTVSGYVDVYVEAPLSPGYYRIEMALVAFNSLNQPVAVISTGASAWCDPEDLNSGSIFITI